MAFLILSTSKLKPMTKTLQVTHKGKTIPITYNSLGHIKDVERSGKFFEIDLLSAIEKLPYRPGICMDIGANVGNHTVFFSNFCKFDGIWSYEPSYNSYSLLLENVKKNGCNNVCPMNLAVGADYGYISMTDNNDNPSWNKVSENGDIPMEPIITDEKVSLMKIDVEEMELEVIKGAYEVIEREKPELFIEGHDGHEPLLKALPKGYRYVRTFCNAPVHYFTAKL